MAEHAVVIDSADIIAVIDTNVMLDLHSCHDYTTRLNPALSTLGDAAWTKDDVWYRGTRARDAVLLAIYLDKLKATTWGSHGEFLDRLTKIVPPDPTMAGGLNWELDYVTNVIHFVNDRLLPNWRHATPVQGERERGNAGDKWLVDEAKRLGVPLISNEGHKTDGTIDETKKIRRLAAASRVPIKLPREFFGGLIDEEAEVEAFDARFIEQARLYTKGRTDGLEQYLQRMKQYFDVILYVHAPPEDGLPTRVE